MSDSFSGYFADISANFQEGMTDVGRDLYAGGSDAYQQFLTADANISVPDGLTGDMVTTGPELETVQSYSSAIMEHGAAVGLEAEARHWREQELDGPDEQAPEISAPDQCGPDIEP